MKKFGKEEEAGNYDNNIFCSFILAIWFMPGFLIEIVFQHFFFFFFKTSFIFCCNSFPPIIFLFRINFVFQRNVPNVIIIFISFLHSSYLLKSQFNYNLNWKQRRGKNFFFFILVIHDCVLFFHNDSFEVFIVYPIRAEDENYTFCWCR